MKQKQFYLYYKKDQIPKNKPISKANNLFNKLYKDNFKISYAFKARKMKVSLEHSLQNVRIKIYEIYQTCRIFVLSRGIYFMAISILKKLSEKVKNITITATQTLACLTLSIKFEQNKHYKLESIIKKSKINQCELIGAQIYILQTLQFKLPLIKIQQYQQVLHQFITDWNTYIHQNIKDIPQNYEVDFNAEPNKQPFQNFVNLLMLSDLISIALIHHTPTLKIKDFQEYLILAANFVALRSASLIDHDINLKSLVSTFYKKKYKKQKVQEKEESKNEDQSEPEIKDIEKEHSLQKKLQHICKQINCEQYIKKISTTDYQEYKIKIQKKSIKKLHEILL